MPQKSPKWHKITRISLMEGRTDGLTFSTLTQVMTDQLWGHDAILILVFCMIKGLENKNAIGILDDPYLTYLGRTLIIKFFSVVYND